LWPSGDYGVHAAEQKAQKTWNGVDMAVSVGSGTRWLGHVPVDDPGPVLMFVGEGGKPNIVRRVRAIAEARGVDAASLPLTVCARAPHLNNPLHLANMEARISTDHPKLVIVDPLYLSARGANLADLYAMGEMLEDVQRLCQAHGAALLVVTHFNRKQGAGAGRITGAGPAEWGRVLLSATVKSRHKDSLTKATTVITVIDIIGGEIPDQTLRVRRRVWADDPENLNSPLHVDTVVTEDEEDIEMSSSEKQAGLTPASAKVLEAMRGLGRPASNVELVDWVVTKHGHGLKRETVSRSLNQLAKLGLARSQGDSSLFKPTLWGATEEGQSDAV
jgi:hypothetical protein